jgi:hypothetical protein
LFLSACPVLTHGGDALVIVSSLASRVCHLGWSPLPLLGTLHLRRGSEAAWLCTKSGAETSRRSTKVFGCRLHRRVKSSGGGS